MGGQGGAVGAAAAVTVGPSARGLCVRPGVEEGTKELRVHLSSARLDLGVRLPDLPTGILRRLDGGHFRSPRKVPYKMTLNRASAGCRAQLVPIGLL